MIKSTENLMKEIKLNGDTIGILGIESNNKNLEIILDIFTIFLEKYLD